MPAETSRTKIISVRIPKQYLQVADALIEAGFFRNRTELTVAAYDCLLRKFAPLLYAYLETKEKRGIPSTPEDFAKFFIEYLKEAGDVLAKTVPDNITDSFYFVVAAKLWDLDRHSPDAIKKLVRAYAHLSSEEGEKMQRQGDLAVPPHASRPKASPGGESPESDSPRGKSLGGESP